MSEQPQEQPPQKLLLTVEEAAALLRIGRATMYRLLGSEEIFSIKVRGCRRVPRSALEQYLQEEQARWQERRRGGVYRAHGRHHRK